MGIVSANVIISNPANRNRGWQGKFLVDTGATDSFVPRLHLEAIGLKPEAYLVSWRVAIELRFLKWQKSHALTFPND